MELSSLSETSDDYINNTNSPMQTPLLSKTFISKTQGKGKLNMRCKKNSKSNFINSKTKFSNIKIRLKVLILSSCRVKIFQCIRARSAARFSLSNWKRSDSIKKLKIVREKIVKTRKPSDKQKTLLSPNRYRTDPSNLQKKMSYSKRRAKQADLVLKIENDTLLSHLEFDQAQENSGWKKISDFILHRGKKFFKKSVKKLNRIKINHTKAFLMNKMMAPRMSLQSVKSIATIQSANSQRSLETVLSNCKINKPKHKRPSKVYKKYRKNITALSIPKLMVTTHQDEKIELKEKSPLNKGVMANDNKTTKLLFRRLRANFSKPKETRKRRIRPKTSQPSLYKSRRLRLKAPKLYIFQDNFKKVLNSQKSHRVLTNRKNYLPSRVF
ncbi:unnamed protein product [Moneuplotes crassus]|uniref:Uncharacterized protein n=1 Tax=Euplotes crassus TaxID=5936 RepID=A0AAD1UML9_EUPCR|nr:unnamed protein product [Moneuplotes crassus]